MALTLTAQWEGFKKETDGLKSSSRTWLSSDIVPLRGYACNADLFRWNKEQRKGLRVWPSFVADRIDQDMLKLFVSDVVKKSFFSHCFAKGKRIDLTKGLLIDGEADQKHVHLAIQALRKGHEHPKSVEVYYHLRKAKVGVNMALVLSDMFEGKPYSWNFHGRLFNHGELNLEAIKKGVLPLPKVSQKFNSEDISYRGASEVLAGKGLSLPKIEKAVHDVAKKIEADASKLFAKKCNNPFVVNKRNRDVTPTAKSYALALAKIVKETV